MFGNLPALADQENTSVFATWREQYGSTFVYRGFVGGRRLFTTDPAALAWILGHAYDFPKPEFVRESLAAMAAFSARSDERLLPDFSRRSASARDSSMP